MKMEIHINAEISEAIRFEAKRRGISQSAVVRHSLAKVFLVPSSLPPRYPKSPTPETQAQTQKEN